ncbi:MAG: hypothetical protein JXA42_08335 [Anaerolineales bacterium]|nr:hypothetical protein [Anaerolineales bacterium]
MNNQFTLCFHIAGSLSADLDMRWTAPFDCTIEHISAVASNDSDATLKVGASDDDDKYLEESAIGDSGVPAEFERADFVGDQFPRIQDGDVVVLSLDHDGDSGAAAHDVTIIAALSKG